MTAIDSLPSRDPLGIATASILLAVAAVLAVVAGTGSSWWVLLLLLPASALFVLGVTGLVLSVPRVPRDEEGNRIEQ